VKIFIDTSAFCGAAIPADPHNAAAKEIFIAIRKQGVLYTSNYGLDETYTLLNARAGHRQAVTFIDSFAVSGINMLRVTESVERAAVSIFTHYDTPRLSFTDCTSFALVNAHRLDHVFAFDKHFGIFRFTHLVKVLGVQGI
jgi:predicted nucleic acid-binding protein